MIVIINSHKVNQKLLCCAEAGLEEPPSTEATAKTEPAALHHRLGACPRALEHGLDPAQVGARQYSGGAVRSSRQGQSLAPASHQMGMICQTILGLTNNTDKGGGRWQGNGGKSPFPNLFLTFE